MLRRLVGASVVVVVAATGAASALAAPNDRAAEQCFAAFLRQYDRGVAAGGGPKYAAAIPGETPGIAPLNCDHYWQATGVVGKDRER